MKVLVADDDAVMRCLICHFLQEWGYETIEVTNGAEALEELQSPDAPKLAILDWMMPQMDGIEVCRRLRRGDEPYVYILLLTARQSNDDLLLGLDAGADDYLAKPVDMPQLKARLASGKRIIELQEKLIGAYEAKRFEAAHDSLTGLWNRTAIVGFLHGELARSRREHTSVSVLMCDIDKFKAVNDHYGHHGGDEVLRQVSSRLSLAIRNYEWISRYGGEEFLIVVPNCNSTAAAQIAERLRTCICDVPIIWNELQIDVSMSLGVATTVGDHELTEEALVQAADMALYRAKDAGRNRVEIASEKPLKTVTVTTGENPCGSL